MEWFVHNLTLWKQQGILEAHFLAQLQYTQRLRPQHLQHMQRWLHCCNDATVSTQRCSCDVQQRPLGGLPIS